MDTGASTLSIIPVNPWLAHRHRRAGSQIDTVVLHNTEANDPISLIDELRRADRSYHYILDPVGDVHKCVPYSSLAFHANNSYGPHEAARGLNREQDARFHFVEHTTVNDYSIGMCLVTPMGKATAEQRTALLALINELKAPLPKLKTLTHCSWIAPGQFATFDQVDMVQLAIDSGLDLWFPE